MPSLLVLLTILLVLLLHCVFWTILDVLDDQKAFEDRPSFSL